MKKKTTLFFILAFCAILLLWYRIWGMGERAAEQFDNVIKHFPFSAESSLREWEEKIFKGKVDYRVEMAGTADAHVLAVSENSASALFYKVNLAIKKHPLISWRWSVRRFPEKKYPESISSKKEEDFAARIYVIFPAAFFTNSKVIEYIWAHELPEGEHGPSGYSKNIRVMVLRSGDPKGKWVAETRNVYEDYVMLFGEEPEKNVGAIAFMTDADSTDTNASSVYDEISVGYLK